MNKPTLIAILAAFEKVVKPGLDDGVAPSRVDQALVSMQAEFLCELETLIKHQRALHMSRLVALGELAAAVGEAFAMFKEPIAVTEDTIVNAERHIGPWFEQLRLLCK